MSIWQLSKQDGTLVGYVPDAELSMTLARCRNTIAVRDALNHANATPVDMQLAKPVASTVEKSKQDIPDFITWSWMAIFSDRVVSTAIEMGCESHDFWPCRFQTNPDEKFFFHLPTKTLDVVDVERSTFRHILPLKPPVPMFIEHLVTKELVEPLPPCFRADVPGTEQIFPELFVREDFKRSWEKKAFTGGTFRRLSS